MESCRRSDIGPVAMHAELLHLLILHSRIQYRQVLQSNCWGRQQARPIIAQRRCLSCLYQPAVALCTARQLSRHRHNAVRLAHEARTRGFCSQRSSDQASSTARVSASSGGIGSTMLAGLKKAFTKVKYLAATVYRRRVSQDCPCCNRSLTSQYNRVQPHHS